MLKLAKTKIRIIALGTTAFVALAGAGILVHQFSVASAQTSTMVENPAVPVSVRTVRGDDVVIWSEFSARLNAVDYAEVRPEVSGRITEIRFTDGESVEAGAVLFVIDPRPYQAAMELASANLASARTNADFARTEFDRAAALIETQAIAQRLYDERANAKRVADAALQAAQAELRSAELDVEHAFVRAPISGRLSRAEITLGNLVQAGPNAPVLTSIVSDNGIYAEFEIDEQTYLEIRAAAPSEEAVRRIPVEMRLSGKAHRSYGGTIHSFDNRLDTTSGTIRARALFDNADGELMPGMFATLRVASGESDDALLVPERAIGSDQDKKFIFVVEGDNKVAYREVDLGHQVAGQRIVLAGLEAGERVVVDGLQHIRPEVTVAPTEVASAVP